MRNHIRKNLAIFIMACSISLLPSFQSRNATDFPNSEVAYNENYQVATLDEQYYTTTENAPKSKLSLNYDFESVQYKRQTLLDITPITTEQEPFEPTLVGTNQPFFQVETNTNESSFIEEDEFSIDSHSAVENLENIDKESSINTEGEEGYIDGLEESEYWWLCKIVMAEVGYASYQMQQVIACEVINRLECWYFPDTIEEVIMQPGQYYNGPPCFTDSDGVWREVEESDITDSVKKAVHSALVDGVDYSNGAFFHIEPSKLSQSVVDRFYELYGDPCLELEGGLFFTEDLCDSLEEWQEKYIK